MTYDLIIIGAGVVGGAVARRLSRYDLSILCLEKEVDVCCGTSKANTGIIHSPSLVPVRTLKAAMTVAGASKFPRLSEELGFDYQKTGALVLGFSKDDESVMEKYIAAGIENYRSAGAEPPEYRIIRGGELRREEPSVNSRVVSALYAPDAGRIIPYEYGIALWENAVENGVRLELGQCVSGLEALDEDEWIVRTTEKEYRARYVVNAAGHGSPAIGRAAGFPDCLIQRVKGQYLILDRNKGPEINHILFQVPQAGQKNKGKGILVTRTVYGNIMIGPDARWQDDDTDTSTDTEALRKVVEGALASVAELNPVECIKTFAGVRPKPESGDFIIESERNFINLCGIESPGLTSSPAIAADVEIRLANMGMKFEACENYQPRRSPIVKQVLSLLPDELKKRIDADSGTEERLICRCEQVPEKRILDAISRGIPVTTIDGVKRRTRAGQGRCQGGFCGSRVRSLLAGKLGIPDDAVTQRGAEAPLDRVTAAEIRRLYKK